MPPLELPELDEELLDPPLELEEPEDDPLEDDELPELDEDPDELELPEPFVLS